MRVFTMACLLIAASCPIATALDGQGDRDKQVRSAVRRSIPLLEAGASGSSAARSCFTCHNQAMPVLALSAARERGFSIDAEVLQQQVAHTKAHLQRGRDNYLKGKGQGGRVVTAGYALLALGAASHKPDETTAAVAGYLLETQKGLKHWRQRGKRPPTSGSDFTATFVALKGLQRYAAEGKRPLVNQRFAEVRQWLETAKTKDTEDRVFRLYALHATGAKPVVIKQQVDELLEQQREDGGWSQIAKQESDAYATGSVLAALMQAGAVSVDHKAIQRGVDFLLDSQLEDGSWRVATRAEGFQEYFESGFPHGEDQFISIAASSWATLSLTLTLPPPQQSELKSDSPTAKAP